MECCCEKIEIEVIARGVCIKGGKLLVCHSKGAPNTYLPGGHVEFGEKAKESLRREMQEEMGLPFKAGRFLGAVEHAYLRKGKPQHEVNLVFEMTCGALASDEALKSCEDYIEFFWVQLKDLKRSKLEPSPLRKLVPEWVSAPPDKVSRWYGTM